MSAIEILEKVDTFTQAEKERFNAIATQSNEDELTFDDLELYARFKVNEALTDERFAIERKAMMAKAESELNASMQIKEAAVEKMRARRNLAQAKLAKAVRGNGEVSK